MRWDAWRSLIVGLFYSIHSRTISEQANYAHYSTARVNRADPKWKGEGDSFQQVILEQFFNHPRLDISTDWNRTKVGKFTTQNGTDHGGSGSDLRWRSFYPAPFPTRVQALEALETLLRSGCIEVDCTDVPGLLLQGRMLLPDEEGVGASSWAARVTGSYWFCIFSILRSGGYSCSIPWCIIFSTFQWP